jgi:hypothetical protein
MFRYLAMSESFVKKYCDVGILYFSHVTSYVTRYPVLTSPADINQEVAKSNHEQTRKKHSLKHCNHADLIHMNNITCSDIHDH